MFSIKILLVVGTLVVCINSVLSIKCYRCESDTNENCGENFNAEGALLDDCNKVPPPRHLMNILGEYTTASGCAKVRAERNGKPVIIRSCYFGDINNTERGCTPNPAEFGTVYKSCEVCSKDSCNGSHMIRSVAFLVLLSSIAAVLLAK